MTTQELDQRFGTIYESGIDPGGQYGRDIPIRVYGCGCSAANVTPDDWHVKLGERCTKPEHRPTFSRS